MPLRKLSNEEIIQIQLSHDEKGRRYATVYGVGFKLRKGSPEEREAYEIARLMADEVEVICDEDNDDVCDMFEGDYDFWDVS